MIQLDADAAAGVADRQVGIQPTVLDAQVVKVTKCLAGEITELGVVPLGLKLGDDNDGQHHPVLCEPADRSGIGEQDAGVQDVSAARRAAGGLRSPPGLARAC